MNDSPDPCEPGAFRAAVRAFLEAKLTPELREAGRKQIGVFAPAQIGRQWHRILYEQGWITPTWPEEFGGRAWAPWQKYIFEQECALAYAPTLSAAGLLMCGPILIHFGTPEQRARFLPPLRSGETYWCQGYSEPGAGSDLAALSCRARLDGDSYVVSGTKIWTTHAHCADWIFLLVRSASGERPQQGITFLLCDMRSPGIEVRPIMSMSGEHEVNQVFFDEVRVPVSQRIGEEGAGWGVAKKLLEFERSGVYGPRVRRLLGQAEHLARGPDSLWTQDWYRRRHAEISMRADALEAGELRILSGGVQGGQTSSASLLKLTGTELLQQASELCVTAGGLRSAYRYADAFRSEAVDEPATAMARYLNMRAATIYGGSSEIQRNLLAKTALGL